jgi:PQQ-like domain
MSRSIARAGGVLAAAGALAWAVAPSGARGQTLDVARPAVFTSGTPAAGARVPRVDAARTGFSRSPLPASQVHTMWHTSVGLIVEQVPLVDEQGTIYVVGNRGEIVALAADGEERWRLTTGAAQPGPTALLADRTLVFVDGAGEALAVRDGAVQWRTRFGRGGTGRLPPVPLDDGGVVVGTSHELALLDATGHTRARTVLPEISNAPLVAALGKIVVVGASGAVWSWVPGAPEPVRVGTFGAAIDGGAALADDHTAIAVIAGQPRLVALDLWTGTATLRSAAPAGVWLGPPALRAGGAYFVALSSTAELALAVDASGAELGRTLLTMHPPSLGDAGAAPSAAPPHTAPLVDAAGTLAFATTDGSVGVVASLATATPTLELVADACPVSAGPSRNDAPVAGLAPLPPGAFVAACTTGTVVAVGSGPAGRRSGRR